MEYPFDDLHAGVESQIMNLPAGIPDSEAVTQAKGAAGLRGQIYGVGKSPFPAASLSGSH